MSNTTALSRKKLSVPVRPLVGGLYGRILDYGCGRGGDVSRLRDLGYDVSGYDPGHEEWSDRPRGRFSIILCTYVLNVVTPEVERDILADIESLLTPGGRAYITVRRDLPPEGKRGRGCWQRWSTPAGCLSIKRTSSYETYVRYNLGS